MQVRAGVSRRRAVTVAAGCAVAVLAVAGILVRAGGPDGPALDGPEAPDVVTAELADGDHTAYVVAVDPVARLITFDEMEWLHGADAAAAWRQVYPQYDNADEPPNGDFVLWNAGPELGVAPLDPGVTVTRIGNGRGVGADVNAATLETLAADVADERSRPQEAGEDPRTEFHTPYVLTVKGGSVTRIAQSYVA